MVDVINADSHLAVINGNIIECIAADFMEEVSGTTTAISLKVCDYLEAIEYFIQTLVDYRIEGSVVNWLVVPAAEAEIQKVSIIIRFSKIHELSYSNSMILSKY